MIITQCYKLKPNKQQAELMGEWLNMLRAHYNYCLRDRISAYEQLKAPVMGDYCRLDNQGVCCPLTCIVSKSATIGCPWTKSNNKRGAYAQQSSSLPELKAARPWYKKIYSAVLQQNLKRLDKAFQNFFKGKRGYPRFKTIQKFRSFNYASGQVNIKGDRVHLPSIGWMRFYRSRPLTDGFNIKTVTIRKKSDGWYMSVTLEDQSVPAPMPIDSNQVKTAIGVDLGIKKLASLSQGSVIPNPQFYKQVERRRTIRYRAASRKQKGSRNKSKAYQYLARLEQKVANRRTDYQWKVANLLCNLADAIIFEDLNIKGMMARCKPKQDEQGKYLPNGQSRKRGLNRVIADASWGELKQKVKSVAEKFGGIVLEVNPRHTSQTCFHCGCVSKDNRNGERF
ncbi:MAG: RNA-guided endonuclease InsQ/TnpB family protein, partial [Xenococcaceae cyanobacterium]